MNEEKYPEYYRKPVEYVKGSNYDVPEPFKIGNLSLNTLTMKLTKPWTPEIFMECYCVARNQPITREITKPRTETKISLWIWVLLAYPELYCDWPVKLFRCSRFSNFDGKEKRNEIKDGKICFEYSTNWGRAPSLLRVFSPNSGFEIQWRDSSENVAGLKSELAFFEPLSQLFLPT